MSVAALRRTADRLGADSRLAWAVALALTLLFAALSLHGLGGIPLWNDEAFSFFVSWQDVAHTLGFIRQDTQPPAYYLLLTGCLRLGHDILTLRAPSVLAMALVLPLLFDAARRLFGVRVALLAVLLFAIGPGNVALAQRARPYGLQTLFAAVAMWGFLRIWLAGAPRPWLGWLAYVLGGGLAVLTQYPAVFFLLGCNAGMALRLALAWDRALARRWVLAQAAFLLVWLPWLPEAARQVSGHLTPAAIAARHSGFLVDGGWLGTALSGLLAVPFLWRGQVLFDVLFAAAALAGVVALARQGVRGLPVLAVVLAPLAACLLAWALVHPVFGYIVNSFLWLHMPYCMLLAAGLQALRPRLLGAGLAALLLLGDLWGLANYQHSRTVPLDAVAALIAADLQPGDGLVLSTEAGARWALAYYLGPPYAGHIDGLDIADIPVAGWPIASPARALAHRRLWLVVPDAETPAVAPAALAPAMTLALHRRFADLTVDRYDRAAP